MLGNHDLFHHWREPSFGRADLERGLAQAGVRLLEDTAVTLPCGVRIVGRKDYLYTNGRRFTAAQLMPSGPDDRYTIWLDHEPRDFKNATDTCAAIVSGGTGTWGYKFRTQGKTEIVCVEIKQIN